MRMFRPKLVITVLVAVLAAFLLQSPAFAADPTDVTVVERTITPDTVAPDEEAIVALRITGEACRVDNAGADVALVVDRSLSMYFSCSDYDAQNCPEPPEDRIGPAVAAAKNFLDRLDFSIDQSTVIRFSRVANVMALLGATQIELNDQLDSLPGDPADEQTEPGAGGTQIGRGISVARNELNSIRHKSENARAMIVLSDGVDAPESSDPVGEASLACNLEIQVFTIGLGSDVDPVMEDIPCNGGFYSEAPTPTDLDEIYQSIADTVLGPMGTNAVITDTVPAGLTVTPGSISNGGVLTDNTIRWELAELAPNTTLTYRVSGPEAGEYEIGSAVIAYTGCEDSDQSVDFLDGTLTIVAPTALSEDDEPMHPDIGYIYLPLIQP